MPPLSGPLPRIKQKGIKQKGIKQKGIKQKGIKQKGIKQKGIKQKGIKQKGIKQEGIKQKGIKQKGIKQKGIKQKGIKQKGIKQKGIKQKGITVNKGRILTKAVILLILSITLVTGAACAKDAPSTSERAQEDGHDPVLRCTYYPQYNKSLLYVRDFYIDEMGMTDEFFDGNICRENPGRTRN